MVTRFNLMIVLILQTGVLISGNYLYAQPESKPSPAVVEFYVSLTGNDDWSGRLPEPGSDHTDGPFATFERAQTAVRTARREQPELGIVVYIRGGVYQLATSIEFTAADSGTQTAPVLWTRYKSEHVTLSAGRQIADWTAVSSPTILNRLPEVARHHVLQADLRAHGVVDFGSAAAPGMQAELFCDWSDGRQRIRSVDLGERIIHLEEPHHHYGYRPGQRYYAFNILAELDSPGEWYLDRSSGLLYFWPPDGTVDAVQFSVLPNLMTLRDASWITLRGLILENARSTAVTIDGGEEIRIGGCLIRNVGGWGVTINGGRNHLVIGCDLTGAGEGGVLLSGGDRTSLTPGGHVAQNNHIHHYARLVRTYRPAIRLLGVGQRASHNWIHDVCQETGDVGAFYMGRDWTERGNVVRHNFFHHLSGPGLHGAMAVYLDDAASGTLVSGNIFFQASRAAFIGGGRDNVIRNNIFVDCSPSVHVDARGLGWMHETVAPGGVLHERLAAVPFAQPPWSERYPELTVLTADNPAAPRGNLVHRNIRVGGEWLNLEPAAEAGVEFRQNLVDQDPLFVNAAALDFRLQDDSPAWKIGFEKIPVEQIGLQDDEWRSSIPGRLVRVAAISFVPRKFDPAWNMNRLKDAFRQARREGAQLAVAPEGVLEGYVVNEIIAGEAPAEQMRDVAITIDSPEIHALRHLAAELQMCLVFGFAERVGDDVYNAAVFIDNSGRICGRYHKMILAEGYDESWWFNRPGSRSRAFDTPFGRCGILICNDRWQPSLAKLPALDGAQFLVIPSYGSTSVGQDEAVLARGVENHLPVVEANVGVTLVVSGNEIVAVDREPEGITYATIEIPPPRPARESQWNQQQQDFLSWRHDELKRRLAETLRRQQQRGNPADQP